MLLWAFCSRKVKVPKKKNSLKGYVLLAAVLFAAYSAGSGGTGIVKTLVHPHVAAGPVAGGNEGLANEMAAGAPWYWTGTQETCLDELWTRESGFSNTADTRVTHAGGDGPGSPVFAYGIAQARPASKYPLAGRPPDLGGRSDPATQVRWGLEYIRDDYVTPCGAWDHEEANGWY